PYVVKALAALLDDICAQAESQLSPAAPCLDEETASPSPASSFESAHAVASGEWPPAEPLPADAPLPEASDSAATAHEASDAQGASAASSTATESPQVQEPRGDEIIPIDNATPDAAPETVAAGSADEAPGSPADEPAVEPVAESVASHEAPGEAAT